MNWKENRETVRITLCFYKEISKAEHCYVYLSMLQFVIKIGNFFLLVYIRFNVFGSVERERERLNCFASG